MDTNPVEAAEGKGKCAGGSCRGAKTVAMLGIIGLIGLGGLAGAACAKHGSCAKSAAPAVESSTPAPAPAE